MRKIPYHCYFEHKKIELRRNPNFKREFHICVEKEVFEPEYDWRRKWNQRVVLND